MRFIMAGLGMSVGFLLFKYNCKEDLFILRSKILIF